MHKHLSRALSRLWSLEPVAIVWVPECLPRLHPIHLHWFRARMIGARASRIKSRFIQRSSQTRDTGHGSGDVAKKNGVALTPAAIRSRSRWLTSGRFGIAPTKYSNRGAREEVFTSILRTYFTIAVRASVYIVNKTGN
jgi:hypothetical protein